MWNIMTAIVTVLVAVIGWFVGHRFNVKRDRENKLRDLRIQYLIEAYRRLESAANRPETTKKEQDRFETALADIQLLGTKEQIEKLMEFLVSYNSQKGAPINPLLELLRSHLRKELDLDKQIPEVKIFRFEKRFSNSALKQDASYPQHRSQK